MEKRRKIENLRERKNWKNEMTEKEK